MIFNLFPKPLLYVLLIAFTIYALFPITWMISTSLRESDELLAPDATIIPKRITIRNYRIIANPPMGNDAMSLIGGTRGFLRMILMTLLYAIATTLVAIPLALMASYTLAKDSFGKKPLFIVFLLFCYLLPPIALVVPLFTIMTSIGLYDSFPGLVISYQILVLPLSIWMLFGYFRSFPKELEESALVDGCSKLRCIFKVVIPVSAPAIAAIATFSMVVIWQEFLFAMIMTKAEWLRNVQVGLQYFFLPGSPVDWGVIMAMSTLIALPTAVLFAYIQQFLVGGLLAGAVKG